MGSLIFRQLFDSESSTYTYLIADSTSKKGALIDPVLNQHTRDLQIVRDLEISLQYILETHVHADHVTGAHKMREATGARIGLSAHAGAKGADFLVEDDGFLRLDSLTIRAIATPGHTNGCMSYVVGDRVFTGDTLLIRGTGRTDFQEGSPQTLYHSIRDKLFLLPPPTTVYPAHNYTGLTASTIDEERRLNPRIKDGITEEEFVRIMENLTLPPPKHLHEAVPANLCCGRPNP